jgi:hypothetical protein
VPRAFRLEARQGLEAGDASGAPCAISPLYAGGGMRGPKRDQDRYDLLIKGAPRDALLLLRRRLRQCSLGADGALRKGPHGGIVTVTGSGGRPDPGQG